MIFEKIKSILSEQFDIEEEKISYDTDFVEDLNADSLDIIDFFSTVSEEFGLDAGDIDLVNNFKNVGDVVKYIEDHGEI